MPCTFAPVSLNKKKLAVWKTWKLSVEMKLNKQEWNVEIDYKRSRYKLNFWLSNLQIIVTNTWLSIPKIKS